MVLWLELSFDDRVIGEVFLNFLSDDFLRLTEHHCKIADVASD